MRTDTTILSYLDQRFQWMHAYRRRLLCELTLTLVRSGRGWLTALGRDLWHNNACQAPHQTSRQVFRKPTVARRAAALTRHGCWSPRSMNATHPTWSRCTNHACNAKNHSVMQRISDWDWGFHICEAATLNALKSCVYLPRWQALSRLCSA